MFDKPKNHILLTGAPGFLGNDIATYFHNNGYEIIGIDRNEPLQKQIFPFKKVSLPSKNFDEILKQYSPHVIIHAAGTASVHFSMENPYEDFRGSVDIYANVLDSVRKIIPQCKVFFLSSAAVYGNPQSLPIKEDHPLHPISAYGFHKLMAEELSREYHNLYGLQVANIRIFSAYGERLRKQVIFEMTQKFFSDLPVILFGTGNESRDFIHSLDIARAIKIIIGCGDFANGTYNLASGIETRINELAGKVSKYTNNNYPIAFDGKGRSGDPYRWQADISKLRKLGFIPSLSLDAGLERVVDFWKKNL